FSGWKVGRLEGWNVRNRRAALGPPLRGYPGVRGRRFGGSARPRRRAREFGTFQPSTFRTFKPLACGGATDRLRERHVLPIQREECHHGVCLLPAQREVAPPASCVDGARIVGDFAAGLPDAPGERLRAAG